MGFETNHESVLLQQVKESLNLKEGEIFVDATLGGGGHAKALCQAADGKLKIIGFDKDEETLEKTKEKLSNLECSITCVLSDFRSIKEKLDELGVDKVYAFLFDLGMSSFSIESSGRGFSFQRDEPLLMTYEVNPQGLTAKQIVNEFEEDQIEVILRAYGEEKYSRKIAREIVKAREEGSIETTHQLVEIIERAVPVFYKRKRTHPATKTFQALRMAVNDEIEAINEGLEGAFLKLSDGGRIAVISFHSIEDRVVKRFFKEKVKKEEGKLLTKKPQVPYLEEIKQNPRARSAKLRVLIKTTN